MESKALPEKGQETLICSRFGALSCGVHSVRAHYEDPETAADYRRRFSKSWTRRVSNRLELRMLGRALRRAGTSERMLDVPCGAGRLLPVLRAHGRELVAVDGARAMLDEARRGTAGPGVRFVHASAFDLPFMDKAFDVAVCWRLIQHFPDPADRRRLLVELARVTRRAIVLSFSDAGTARARRLEKRARRRGGRVAIGREELAAEVGACGMRPDRFYRLFGPLSVVAAVVIVMR
jgi:SAM-dependent methyltransferase